MATRNASGEIGSYSLEYRVRHRPGIGGGLGRFRHHQTGEVAASGHHPGQATVDIKIEDRKEDPVSWDWLEPGSNPDDPPSPLREPNGVPRQIVMNDRWFSTVQVNALGEAVGEHEHDWLT